MNCSYPENMENFITDLKVCLMKEPFGVLPEDITFSFRASYGKPEARQTHYRITAAKGKNGFERGEFAADTGFVASSACTGIRIKNAAFVHGALYYWSVDVIFDDGTEISSAPSFFSTAPDDIGAARAIWCEGDPYFAFFRSGFSVGKTFDKVGLTVCASSPETSRQFVCTVCVNGEEVGVTPSRHGKTPDGRAVLYYKSFDITKRVKNGANTAEALCGTDEDKRFFCTVYGFDSGGDIRILTDTSDETWSAFNGDRTFRPDNSVGTHYYKAYAANTDTAYLPENAPELWSAPADKGPMFGGCTAYPAYTPAIFRHEVPAAGITRTCDGYLIDLGCEIIGGVRAVFTASEPEEIEAFYGEEKNADGTVKYKMNTGNVYYEKFRLCVGTQTVSTPDLLTFRYVEFKGKAELFSVCGLEIRADNDNSASSFDSDNKLLNRLYALTKRTVEAASQDLYVDSQSRERGAYEGDMLVNMLCSYCFYPEYSIPRFSAEYIYTHRTWPAEYLLLTPLIAYADYMYSGDISSLEKYYPIIKNNKFSANEGKEGLIHSGNFSQQGENAVLTDWPPSERDGYDTSVKYNTVLNCVAALSYTVLSLCARALGKKPDAEGFDKNAKKLKKAIVKYLFDKEKGCFCDGLYGSGEPSPHHSQHASAYALYCGVCGKNEAKKAASFIKAAGKIKMSVYGAFFLLAGLYKNGFDGTANALLLDNDESDGARTWAYMLDILGATLTAEAWNAKNKPNMTFSHPWSSAPAYCITGGIFGIGPILPGFEKFAVRFGRCGVNRASVTVPTVRGAIKAAFDGDAYSVTVPTGCTAEISVKTGKKTLYHNGTPTDASVKNGVRTVTVQSGEHRFEARRSVN